MRKVSGIRLCFNAINIKAIRIALGFLSIATASAFGFSAHAQDRTPAKTASEGNRSTSFCSVEWRDDLAPAIGKSRMAVALCGQHAFVLGLADEFKITMNEGEGAALVDLFRNGARRVLLVSRQGQERPLLEDISGQISMSAGKGPMSTLEDIEIDFAGFASDGVIVVQGHPTDSKAGQIVRVDLKQQVDGVRAARLAAAK